MRGLLRHKSHKSVNKGPQIEGNPDNLHLKKGRKSDDTFFCKVRLLDDAQTPLDFCLKKTDSGQILFDFVCEKLGELLERDYFGLRYADKHKQRQWLDLQKTVYKQIKDSKSHSFSFRVKHYPPDPIKDLKQNLSRYLLYQQIRRDLAQGRLLCSPTMIGTIGALVLQAELGDAPSQNRLIEANGNVVGVKDVESIEGDTSSANISSANFDHSTDQHVNGAVPSYECLRKMKIIFNQTPDMEEEIMKEYQNLRGLNTIEAESELLSRVSQSPTYGVDPFLTSVSNKSSSHLSINPPISKEASLYLGLSHTGVVIFVGRQRSHEYVWTQIRQLSCDGKRFQIHLQKEKGPLVKRFSWSKSVLLSFHCQSEAAALAFWRWALDRMNFFTLKEANKAKKFKSSSAIFNRSHTYRFSGRSHFELNSSTKALTNVPQPEFTRISSFRQAMGMYKNLDSNGTIITHSTLPGRLHPSYGLDENCDNGTQKLTEISNMYLGATSDVIKEKNDSDIINENPIDDQTCNAQLITTDTHAEQLRNNGVNTCDLQGTSETPIEPTTLSHYMTASNMPIDQLHQHVHKFTDNDEQKYEYTQVFNALDKTIESHMDANYVNMNGNLNISKQETLIMNGDVRNTELIESYSNGKYNHYMSTRKKYHSKTDATESDVTDSIGPNSKTTLTVVFIAIISVIVILESTPSPNAAHNSNILYRLIRGNYLMVTLDDLIYHPLRNTIANVLAAVWSILLG